MSAWIWASAKTLSAPPSSPSPARQVTYADPHGWDTEGGVIVLAHRFPDGSQIYSLYGHIAPEGASFPAVGRCMEAGTVLARIGAPTLSAPHLHFEFRDFLPDSGGPGYVPGNPLEAGWFHPLDFAAAWRLRLNLPARAAYTSPQTPTLPPVLLPDGQLVLASGNTLLTLSPLNELHWRLQSNTPLHGLLALADGRIVASTHAGQVLIVRGGRYQAIWSPAAAPTSLPPIALAEILLFVTDAGALAAHTPTGELRWQTGAIAGVRAVALGASGAAVALLLEETQEAQDGTPRPQEAAGARLLLYAAEDGRRLGEWRFATLPLWAARPSGGWWLYDGSSLSLLAGARDGTPRPQEVTGEWQLDVRATLAGASAASAPDRAAQLHALADGGAALFMGGVEAMMIAFAADGRLRWEQPYPSLSQRSPPLLASAADSCWLAALAADGTLLFLSGQTGSPLLGEQWPGALYPGSQRQRQPAARTLQRQGETLVVGAGFLSVLVLDIAAAPAELRCGTGE